ncbi:MAG TPA: HIT family protein [Patescibacteria group bacterium]|nr:HIT family protein [Patescibacteria group bacterium]
MTDRSLFEKIVANEIPSFKVWEDENYLAFLTPYPNTPGVTVVIPKKNVSDYIFAMDDQAMSDFMVAVKQVAKILEEAFDVSRVAVAFEGTGVAHVHAKLYPLHGKLGDETNVWSHHQEFYPEYIGYFSTTEGPRMSDEQLTELQEKIKKAAA